MSELAAIQSQISRYTDAVNSRNWDDFPSIFAEDARWEAVAREDVGILEKQHRAFLSCRAKPGTLSWREDRVLALNNWVLSRLPDDEPGEEDPEHDVAARSSTGMGAAELIV